MATKYLRVGFYGVTVFNDPAMRFEQILRRFSEQEIADDESRTVDSRDDQPIRLQTLRQSRNLWIGDMVRIRLHEDLIRIKRSGQSRKIDFDDDEGLGGNTAFLYHPATRTMAIHESRGAVPLSAFPLYFKLLGEVRGVEFKPLLRPESIERIARMGAHYKFEIAIEPGRAREGFHPDGAGAEALFNVADYFHGRKVHVSVDVPKIEGTGGLTGVMATIRGLMPGIADPGPVTKALVIGSSPDGERAEDVVNLLDDRLIELAPVEVRRGERITDADRHNAVRTAWNTHAASIEQYYTRLDA